MKRCLIVDDSKVIRMIARNMLQEFGFETLEAENGQEALDSGEVSDKARSEAYKVLLTRAYQDFVESDAQTEKVFKVFKMQEPQTTFVSVDSLFES